MADQPIPAEQADPALSYAQSAAGLTGELASVPQTQSSITVNHDNVLQAAQVISQILQENGSQIAAQLPYLEVAPAAKDPVSVAAAAQWNARLVSDGDSYANRVQEYLQSLQTVANNLAASAKQYGYSDEEIAAAFKPSGIASA
jgi:PE family